MNALTEQTRLTSRVKIILATIAVVWLLTAYAIGNLALLPNRSGGIIAPIAATAVIPVVVFLGVYALSASFRRVVLAQDIRSLTMIQHWRVIGFAFLLLYSFNVLPGLFAWPAGVGDVAVGLGAFFVIRRLDRDPEYAMSGGLVRFHLLGLLDFAVAVVTAGLAAGSLPGLVPEGVTSAPLDVWPLSLFPSFIVPLFIILHLTVLLKVRHLRQATGGSVQPALA